MAVPTFLLSRPACPLDHDDRDACRFQVAWAINPHMRIGAASPARACAQHRHYVDVLRGAGARVIRLPFVHGAFDSVFMKDAAIIAERDGRVRALLASPCFSERKAEQAARAAHLARIGAEVAPALDECLEGGDVVIAPRANIALLGHGVRSSAGAARGLSRFLGCDAVPLALRDPAFFHLDTALAILRDDTAVVCEEALTDEALRTLASLPLRAIHTVSKAEAMRFSLNVVDLGDRLVTGTFSASMLSLWRRLGREPIVAPLDEFQLAGGSAACLVARVHALEAAPAAALAA